MRKSLANDAHVRVSIPVPVGAVKPWYIYFHTHVAIKSYFGVAGSAENVPSGSTYFREADFR